jgi:hypothetical protein
METTVKSNPLLENLRLPGETVRLPSGGMFYKNGELASHVNNGEIHVYPMNTYEEILMKSPDKLLNGDAVQEVFTRCIPDILKPLDLFARDVDYLILVLRRVTYGNTVDIPYTHNCDSISHTYVVDISPFIQQAKIIDPTTLSTNYQLTLPNQQVVEIIPVRFGQTIKMLQEGSVQRIQDLTDDDIKNQFYDSLVSVISAVDGCTDPKMIREWIEQISAGWSRQIQTAMERNSNWGPETVSTVICKTCQKPLELDLSLNPITFFS